MDQAISNIKIEKFFNDEQNEDLKKITRVFIQWIQ